MLRAGLKRLSLAEVHRVDLPPVGRYVLPVFCRVQRTRRSRYLWRTRVLPGNLSLAYGEQERNKTG
jgi:hypothetical protein